MDISTYECENQMSLFGDKRSFKITNHIRLIELFGGIGAQAFIPNPDNLPEVNHKDLNKHNNRVDNLEWVTGEENRRHYNNIENMRKDGTIK